MGIKCQKTHCARIRFGDDLAEPQTYLFASAADHALSFTIPRISFLNTLVESGRGG